MMIHRWNGICQNKTKIISLVIMSALATLLHSIGLFVASSILIIVIKTYLSTQLAYRRFISQSKGLKVLPGWRPLGGHLFSFFFKSNINNQLLALHAKYGKTFGLLYGSKPFVVTIDLDLIKTIVLDEQQCHTNRTRLFMPMREVEQDCIMFAAGDQWRRLRRAIAPAFRKSIFMRPNVENEINRSIFKLIEAIETKLDQLGVNGELLLNVDDYCHRYTLDLVMNCFYKQNNLIDFQSKHDPMVETLERGLAEVFASWLAKLTIIFTFLRPLVDWLLLHFHPSGSMRQRVMRFIQQQTDLNLRARRELKENKDKNNRMDEDDFLLRDGRTRFNRNMVDYIIDEFHEGRLTRREYYHSTWFLLNAADKSSADALAYTLYMLAVHQDKQAKLFESIRLEGPRSEYLNWVINESLRLMPPGPMGSSRTVERDVPLTSGGVIPKGTFVITPAYAIHRLEEFWGHDAHHFRPERFAAAAAADQHLLSVAKRPFHGCQFMPFGLGARICPGREFALHEMRLLLCQLVARFTFTGEPKRSGAFDAPYLLYVVAHEPAIVGIRRRS